MREFEYKGVKFMIVDGGNLYVLRTLRGQIRSTLGKYPTIAKCKSEAKRFVNEGGWDSWMRLK